MRCHKARLPLTHPTKPGSLSSYWCLFDWEARHSIRPTSNVSRSESSALLSSPVFLRVLIPKQCWSLTKTQFHLSLNSYLKHLSSFPEHLKAGLLYRNHRWETETFPLFYWLPRWEPKARKWKKNVLKKDLHQTKLILWLSIVHRSDCILTSASLFDAPVVSCLTDVLRVKDLVSFMPA